MSVRGFGLLVLVVVASHGVARAGPEPAPRVRVAVEAGVEERTGLAARLAPFAWIEPVAALAGAELAVGVTPEGVVVRGSEGRVLATPTPLDAPELGERVAGQVVAWAHRRLVAGLEAPGSGLALEFTLEREDAPGALGVVEPGTALRWQARNRSARTLYPTLFAISADAGVSLVYPFRGPARALAPGATVEQVVEVDAPEGVERVTDRLTLLVTSAPLEPATFLDPARLAGALAGLANLEWRTARAEIEVRRYPVGLAAPGAAPGTSPEARPGASPEARRAPRTTTFIVRFASDVELGAVQSRLAKLRTLCGRAGTACKLHRLPGDARGFELERTGMRLREGRSQTAAQAFEQAYEIRAQLGAARVEPAFARGPHAPAAGHGGADYGRLFDLAPGADPESVAYFEAELLYHCALSEEVTRAFDALGGPDATPERYADTRAALLRQGLSPSLRAALAPAPE